MSRPYRPHNIMPPMGMEETSMRHVAAELWATVKGGAMCFGAIVLAVGPGAFVAKWMFPF